MRFAEAVREHHVQLRLAPWDGELQRRSALGLVTEPGSAASDRFDAFGNLTHHFAVLGPHDTLTFTLTAEVETRLDNPFDFAAIAPGRERDWIGHALHEAPRLWDFVLHQGALTPELPADVGGRPLPEWGKGQGLVDAIRAAFAWVCEVAEPDFAAETPVSALPALFDAGRGTPADLAHLLIALLRRWGVPARFCSGYVDAAYCAPDDTDPPGTPPRPQALHHWVEALVPGAGWRGFDPSLALLADATYVRVAVGRDLGDVRPLRHTCKGRSPRPELVQELQVTALDGPPPPMAADAPPDLNQAAPTQAPPRAAAETIARAPAPVGARAQIQTQEEG
jgi:transglutaminase-like putative cysteine protease